MAMAAAPNNASPLPTLPPPHPSHPIPISGSISLTNLLSTPPYIQIYGLLHASSLPSLKPTSLSCHLIIHSFKSTYYETSSSGIPSTVFYGYNTTLPVIKKSTSLNPLKLPKSQSTTCDRFNLNSPLINFLTQTAIGGRGILSFTSGVITKLTFNSIQIHIFYKDISSQNTSQRYHVVKSLDTVWESEKKRLNDMFDSQKVSSILTVPEKDVREVGPEEKCKLWSGEYGRLRNVVDRYYDLEEGDHGRHRFNDDYNNAYSQWATQRAVHDPTQLDEREIQEEEVRLKERTEYLTQLKGKFEEQEEDFLRVEDVLEDFEGNGGEDNNEMLSLTQGKQSVSLTYEDEEESEPDVFERELDMGDFNDGAGTQESWETGTQGTLDVEEAVVNDKREERRKEVKGGGYWQLRREMPRREEAGGRMIDVGRFRNRNCDRIEFGEYYGINQKMPSRNDILNLTNENDNSMKRKYVNTSLTNSITQPEDVRSSQKSESGIRSSSTSGGILEKGGYTKQVTSGMGALTLFFIEIYVLPRRLNGRLVSTSWEVDGVRLICWREGRDGGEGGDVEVVGGGSILVMGEGERRRGRREGVNGKGGVEEVESEKIALNRIASLIRFKNPDLILSWDTLDSGLGYIIERALSQEIEIYKIIDRDVYNPNNEDWFGGERKGDGLGEDWNDTQGAGSKASSVKGRLGVSVWRCCGDEVKVKNPDQLEMVVKAVLGRRLPKCDETALREFWIDYKNRYRVIEYINMRIDAVVGLIDKIDVLGRAGEMARLCCVDFGQSLPGIRGSQYRVEGTLRRAILNLANHGHPNYLFPSPSKDQIQDVEALEVIPLVLQPKSGIYHDPVVVCDFTSLYPSLIIAYNLCYSTVCGKAKYETTLEGGNPGTTGRIGLFDYPEKKTAEVLYNHSERFGISDSDNAYVTPSGGVFVGKREKVGVLPKMLEELLETRAMIKRAMKAYKNTKVSRAVNKTLEAKQLAIKLLCNVTYGYTSATFSGRCCCPLVADAIVELARRTLGEAMDLVRRWGAKGEKWQGAEVVYGDTDSVFIKLPGRTVPDAFEFGESYCAEVTRRNPPPVHLKMEKVYLGCMLQTKKKYAGLMYTSLDQKEGVFEAKGIETIRKDQCSMTQTILQGALITLFKTADRNLVRRYLNRQWTKLLAGRLPISDFILTGRVRSSYREGGITTAASLVKR
ncbi:hypothetical protein TrLO_g8868 [Triparma laevis f. longispina]|nr:hypothetical protein TrLO_g8868 [Triparma laevis f. longispina]